MCDCASNLKSKIAEHAKAAYAGKREVEETAQLHNQGMRLLGNKLIAAPYDEYRIRTYPLKKDGTKTGKEKVEVLEVVHSFCPHCGEKYPTE